MNNQAKKLSKMIFHKIPINLKIKIKNSLKKNLTKKEKKYLLNNLIKKVNSKTVGKRKKILFWTAPGEMSSIINVEAMIATALRLRDADVQFVCCDGVLSGCIAREFKNQELLSLWEEKCLQCSEAAVEILDSLALPYIKVGDFISKELRSKLRQIVQNLPDKKLSTFRYKKVNVGKYATASTLRYFKKGSLNKDNKILRKYLYSAMVTTEAAKAIFKSKKPHLVSMTHCTYVDWGPPLSIAIDQNIPVCGWTAAYLKDHFYLNTEINNKHLDRLDMSEKSWRKRKKKKLTITEDQRLNAYFKRRYAQESERRNVRKFDLPLSKKRLLKKLNLLDDKPVWCVFSHINWDAVFNYRPMIFNDVDSWITDTIKIISEIKNINWLIKIHPSESRLPPESKGVEKIVKKRFPELAPHLRLISANSEINPYSFYSMLDGGVTIFGTPGLELLTQGKPVILAGKAHYGSKGFTYDAKTKAQYRQLLCDAANLPALSSQQKKLARRYAYSFFIQRQIPMPPPIRTKGGKWWQIDFNKLEMLLPGRDVVLDMICDRIINGGDFIMEEKILDKLKGSWK